MEESTRQNLIMAFNNVLRTSTLVGVIDFQRAALAFGALLERSGDSGVIDLGPLYDFLIEQKAPEASVVEVIVFMKSRENRFNIGMKLPDRLAQLSQQDIDGIVLAFTSRGATSGTRSGQTPTPIPATGTGQARTQPSVTEASLPSTDFRAKKDAKKEGVSGTVKGLGIVGGILAVLGVGNLVYDGATAPPKPEPLLVSDPAGLPCKTLVKAGHTGICRIPLEAFKAEAPEALGARATITKGLIQARGVNQLLVYTDDDNKLRRSF